MASRLVGYTVRVVSVYVNVPDLYLTRSWYVERISYVLDAKDAQKVIEEHLKVVHVCPYKLHVCPVYDHRRIQ